MTRVLFILGICLLINKNVIAFSAANVCGDDSWLLYKDEKCIKLVDQFLTHDEAKIRCTAEIGVTRFDPLITISSQDEKNVLSQLLRYQGITSVWLNARQEERCSTLKRDLKSGVNVQFTNCEERHLVVCQKKQTWSLEYIQNTLSTLRNELDSKTKELTEIRNEYDELKTQVNDLKTVHDNLQESYYRLENNPVPIGFTYIQFPGQGEPHVIWPTVTWTDVSFMYAGLFFRAVGNNSEEFGTIQEESCPRITNVSHRGGDDDYNGEIELADEWSPYILTGYSYAAVMTNREKISFYSSIAEIRPTNTAVRIWRRTG